MTTGRRYVRQVDARRDATLARLSERTIYFGHQSVGYNVLEGIRDILREDPQPKWNIVETRDLGELNPPFFAHSTIGRNGQPASKLDDFSTILRGRAPAGTDVAFMKFCFVDFTPQTDVKDLFRAYSDTFTTLKSSFPRTTFVHLTVPLTGSPSGFKWVMRNAVKRLVGRNVQNYEDNRTINRFNELVRSTYRGKEPVFDLALLESTHADGTQEVMRDAGEEIRSMASEYTFDGGHLNEAGRRMVAAELLEFLAALPERPPLK